MLCFVEAGGRIIRICRSRTLAFAHARRLSARRMVFVHCADNSFVFHRGRWVTA